MTRYRVCFKERLLTAIYIFNFFSLLLIIALFDTFVESIIPINSPYTYKEKPSGIFIKILLLNNLRT